MSSVYDEFNDLPELLIEEVKELSKGLDSNERKKVLKRVREEFEKAKISPGEAIGVITAESFGEPGTQMILRVFHFAGVAEMSLNLGLARLIELFDARKKPSTPLTTIYLKHGYKTDLSKVKIIAALIKETRLKDIADEFSFNLTQFRIEVLLNKKEMRDLKITESQILTTLKDNFKDMDVKGDNGILKIKPKEKDSLSTLYKLKEKLKYVNIKGIKNVGQVTPVKRDNEYVIYCTTDDLKSVFEVEGVDITKTTANSPFVVAELLGIEAARQVLINEAVEVIKNQGLDIDIRHIMFLADVMTNKGIIKGITRTGITSEKESVLARASFETPIKHMVNASLVCEEDKLKSVIENVMLNQPIPLGTGLPGLVAKMKEDSVKRKK
ncbi:DNA-directed RNA polymerase subunit A'' [Candidatus Woesearchaeota archaeon]|nr:DNA-directed RNA polymerase subunit A'' [Candidatus Woesearchaeota archaeon]